MAAGTWRVPDPRLSQSELPVADVDPAVELPPDLAEPTDEASARLR